jgi:cyclic pyranopterin phosphate synthase
MRIDKLRLSVTGRCNLRCQYCRPAGACATAPESGAKLLSFEEICTVVRALCEAYGLRTVRLTGGEPLLRAGLPELVGMLRRVGVEVRMTTNGQRLAPHVHALRQAGLSRVNISLDTLRPDRFREITGGALRRSVAGLEAACQAGFAGVKTNTVVLRGVNDDEIADIAEFCLARRAEPRFLELMNAGAARARHAERFLDAPDILDRLRDRFRLEALPFRPGVPAQRFKASCNGSFVGVVGLIAPETRPFCASCTRLRLSADGRLFGCLMQDRGTDLKPWLRGGGLPGTFTDIVEAVLQEKPGMRGARRRAVLAGIGG